MGIQAGEPPDPASGEAQLCLSLVPEVARLARRWDLSGLQEALAATVTAAEGGTGLTPEAHRGWPWLGKLTWKVVSHYSCQDGAVSLACAYQGG